MFVQRDGSGSIVAAFGARQPYATEELPDNDAGLLAFMNPAAVQAVLPQDLMAQFSADDAARIQAAVSGNAQFWLLWSAMQAQRDPMIVTNARFRAGWAVLTQVLGQDRMAQIATALNLTIA